MEEIPEEHFYFMIEDEREGHQLYMKLYKRTGDIRFKKMAADETRHRKTLEKMRRERFGW